MTGTNDDDVMRRWAVVRRGVSALLLREGALIERLLPDTRRCLRVYAMGGRGPSRQSDERNLRVSRAFVRFAKALKDLESAACGVRDALASARAELDEADAR